MDFHTNLCIYKTYFSISHIKLIAKKNDINPEIGDTPTAIPNGNDKITNFIIRFDVNINVCIGTVFIYQYFNSIFGIHNVKCK